MHWYLQHNRGEKENQTAPSSVLFLFFAWNPNVYWTTPIKIWFLPFLETLDAERYQNIALENTSNAKDIFWGTVWDLF